MADGKVQKEMLLPKEVLAYIKEHGLDEATTSALNAVLRSRPADPLAHLAASLAKRSRAPPRFEALRSDTTAPRLALSFNVTVATRGVRARLHSFSLGGVLLRPAARPEGDEQGEASLEQLVRAQQREVELVAWLEAYFSRAFKDVPVSDFLSFHDRCAGIADAPALDGFEVDGARATAVLADELLAAAARSRSVSRLEFLQQMLLQEGSSDLVSPPLRAVQDLAAHRASWLRVAMPLYHGGGPSPVKPPALRLCAALSPFATAPSAEVPQPGWLLATLKLQRELAAAAVSALQKEKGSAALAVDGMAYCPASLEKALELAQKSAEAMAGAAESCGLLFAAAEEAWLEGEGLYEFEAGKKLKLEQLVDLYDSLAKSGWLRAVVQPFRHDDALAGCDLLHARRPELRLIMDFGQAEPLPVPARAVYSCGLAIEGSTPQWLRRYAELAPQWREAGGCGRCLWLSAKAAAAMPSALELALACAEAEFLCLPRDLAEEDAVQISARADEVLYRAMQAQGDAEC